MPLHRERQFNQSSVCEQVRPEGTAPNSAEAHVHDAQQSMLSLEPDTLKGLGQGWVRGTREEEKASTRKLDELAKAGVTKAGEQFQGVSSSLAAGRHKHQAKRAGDTLCSIPTVIGQHRLSLERGALSCENCMLHRKLDASIRNEEGEQREEEAKEEEGTFGIGKRMGSPLQRWSL